MIDIPIDVSNETFERSCFGITKRGFSKRFHADTSGLLEASYAERGRIRVNNRLWREPIAFQVPIEVPRNAKRVWIKIVFLPQVQEEAAKGVQLLKLCATSPWRAPFPHGI